MDKLTRNVGVTGQESEDLKSMGVLAIRNEETRELAVSRGDGRRRSQSAGELTVYKGSREMEGFRQLVDVLRQQKGVEINNKPGGTVINAEAGSTINLTVNQTAPVKEKKKKVKERVVAPTEQPEVKARGRRCPGCILGIFHPAPVLTVFTGVFIYVANQTELSFIKQPLKLLIETKILQESYHVFHTETVFPAFIYIISIMLFVLGVIASMCLCCRGTLRGLGLKEGV